MIRFLIRSLGLWLAAGGFAAAVVDGTKSIAASRLVVTPAAITWRDLSPASFESAATALEHGLGAGGRDAVLGLLAVAPTWALFGVLGALLLTLGRRREADTAARVA